MIGFIPLAFLGYQTAELFNEKKHKLNQLDSYRQEIHQSLKITMLMDNLQLETKFSLNLMEQLLNEVNQELELNLQLQFQRLKYSFEQT